MLQQQKLAPSKNPTIQQQLFKWVIFLWKSLYIRKEC